MIQLIKTKLGKIAVLGRAMIPEIRSRSNLIPFKAMIYASSLAMLKAPKVRSANTKQQYLNVANHLKILDYYATRLYGNAEPDPNSLADTLKAGVGSYVDLFYAMDTRERDSYVRSISREGHGARSNSNLLFIPSIMSEAGEDPEDVKNGLFRHLYAVPFKTLHNASRTGIRVLLMENRMAVKSVRYDMLHDFSKSLSQINTKISDILGGSISPSADEEMKTGFIEGAVRISEQTDINIAEIISDKVRTNRQIMLEMHRLIRRARHTGLAR